MGVLLLIIIGCSSHGPAPTVIGPSFGQSERKFRTIAVRKGEAATRGTRTRLKLRSARLKDYPGGTTGLRMAMQRDRGTVERGDRVSDPSGNDGISYEPTMVFPYDGQEHAPQTVGVPREVDHRTTTPQARHRNRLPRLLPFCFWWRGHICGARDPSILTRSTKHDLRASRISTDYLSESER